MAIVRLRQDKKFTDPERKKKRQKTNKYGPKSPLNDKENHDKLLTYLTERLDLANQIRDSFVSRITVIDKELAGFIILDEEDRKREADNQKGKGPKPTKVNLPLTLSQLDEAVTYMMSIFAPDSGMFEAIAAKDQQDIAKGLTLLMNKHADKKQYYRHLAKGILNALKYNLGGWLVYWEQIKGNVITNGAAGQAEIKPTVLWEGNAFESVDMYNFLWDVAVHPVDLPFKGEWFATVKVVNKFRVLKMEQDGEIFDAVNFIEEQVSTDTRVGGKVYYRQKPEIRADIYEEGVGNPNSTDWVAVLSQNNQNGTTLGGTEFVNMYIWLNPSEFGLSEDDELQIWRIIIANGKHICFHEHINYAHGMLPCGFGSPMEDDLGLSQRSHGEQLIPLQRFASFQMNIHQDAARKALYGLTIFDKNVFPMLDEDKTDLVAAKIAAKTTALDQDLRKKFVQFNDAPNTENTMVDIDRVIAIMQKILPTDILKQVADLERATMYQAAATVQGGNRRQFKMAKLINDQGMTPVRFQMLYNIYQFQEEVEIMNDEGTRVKVSPTALRSAELEFAISDGLKGLDRLMVVSMLSDLINKIIQSQQAIQEIDIVGLLDHFTSMIGDRFDLTQFRKKPQQIAESALAANPQQTVEAAARVEELNQP